MKKFIIAGLALFTFSNAIAPAFADTGNSQTSTNISTVESSSRTRVNQDNKQSINSRSRDRNETANVQDGLNDSFVFDSRGTRVDQENKQTIRNRSRR